MLIGKQNGEQTQNNETKENTENKEKYLVISLTKFQVDAKTFWKKELFKDSVKSHKKKLLRL